MYVWTATKKLEKKESYPVILYSNKLGKNRLEQSLRVRLEGEVPQWAVKWVLRLRWSSFQLSAGVGREGPT